MKLERVCVYAASSRQAPRPYVEAARRLGDTLARAGVTIVYGGGATGLMGALADAALSAGGRVIGILPEFMGELEWGHDRLTELQVVPDLHERKRRMLAQVGAVVALPGGCGTLEELHEAITWKRLGLHGAPIVLLNVGGYFDATVAQLERAIADGLMHERHRAIWTVVANPDDVLAAIAAAPPWPTTDARAFAVP